MTDQTGAWLGGSGAAAQDRLPNQCPPPLETSAIFASASWMVKLDDF
jgi:hypothetical protein